MKPKGRIITITLLIIFTATFGQALPSETLEKEEPEITFKDNKVNIQTDTILDKNLTYKQLLLPEQYEDHLEYIETQKLESNNALEIKYSYQNHSEIPESLRGETHTETLPSLKNADITELNEFGKDKITEINHGDITTQVYLHYNKIKTKHIIEGTVKQKDLYEGEKPERLPVNIDRNGEYIELKYDNHLSESKTKELHILRYEESEISQINIQNGTLGETCSPDFEEDTVPQLDESGISTEMMPGHILNHEIECQEIQLDADKVTKVGIGFDNEDPLKEENGNLEVVHTNDHYVYVIGSGSASRAFDGYQFCGGYEHSNIIIDGDVEICEDGATLKAEDTIQINGEIQGQGQIREDGADLTLEANHIDQQQPINLKGGDGGSIIPNAADGGSLTVHATTYAADEIITRGGEGTQGLGGDGGDAGQVNINTNSLQQSSQITSDGGQGGNSNEDNSQGGIGGQGGDIRIDAGEAIIENINIYAAGGNGGQGADGNQNNCDSAPGGNGGDGGGINIQAKNLDSQEVTYNTYSGDGGDAGTPEEECISGDGGDAGTPANINEGLYLHGYNTTLISNSFNTYSGDGGDAQNQDGTGGDGKDGGDLIIKWENEITQENNEQTLLGGIGGQTDGQTGEDGQLIETQEANDFTETTITLEKQSLELTDRSTGQEGYVQQGNNVSIEFNFTTDEDSLDSVEADIFNGEELEEITDLNQQDFQQNGSEYLWSYKGEFDIPENDESAGAWLVTVKVQDDLGDTHARSTETIYMYTEQSLTDTAQLQANLEDPIPIKQTLETSNPTQFDYQNLQLEYELIDTANIENAEIERLDQSIETTADSPQNLLTWETNNLEAQSINEWHVLYDLEPISVEEQIEEEDEEGQVETITKTLTLENPSEQHDIENIVAQPDIPEQDEVVDWSLQFNGEDVTEDSDIEPQLVDTNLDGQEDSVQFNIEELETDETQEWVITIFLGEPITTYSEEVITNSPVQEGKTIEWRVGYAFENNNDFDLQHEEKLRVPLEASNTQLEGELKPIRFDEIGAYIEFEDQITSNSNQTRFLEFESRSISTTSTLEEQDRIFLEDDTTAVIDLKIENLVNIQLEEIQHPVQIQYGENVNVIHTENDETIHTEDTVNQEFTLELDGLEPNEIKDLSVEYSTQTGEKELVREGVTDKGNDLSVYKIVSNSNQPIENTWIEINDIDCIEVEEIRMLGKNQTETTSVIDDYTCGSTRIPLGTLQPDDELHIGIEHRATEPTLETDKPLTIIGLGIGVFLFYGLVIIGVEAGRRRWLA